MYFCWYGQKVCFFRISTETLVSVDPNIPLYDQQRSWKAWYLARIKSCDGKSYRTFIRQSVKPKIERFPSLWLIFRTWLRLRNWRVCQEKHVNGRSVPYWNVTLNFHKIEKTFLALNAQGRKRRRLSIFPQKCELNTMCIRTRNDLLTEENNNLVTVHVSFWSRLQVFVNSFCNDINWIAA